MAAGALAMEGAESAALTASAMGAGSAAGSGGVYSTIIQETPSSIIEPVIKTVNPAPETIVIEKTPDVKQESPNHKHQADHTAEPLDSEHPKNNQIADAESSPPPVVINNITMPPPATMPSTLTAEMVSRIPPVA
jgi:hypothetical protein